jgi:glutathionyl-hydroquinone reductase
MVDYMIWPWLERFEYLEYAKKFEFDRNRCPKLHKYMSDMRQLKAVKDTLIAPDIMDVFAKSMASNDPQYDIGLRN